MSKTDGIGVWVWNENLSSGAAVPYLSYCPTVATDWFYPCSFTCDGIDYVGFSDGPFGGMDDGDRVLVYNAPDWVGGVNSSYRTIVVSSISTKALEFLSPNATYQEPTPSTPTFLNEQGLRALAEKTKAYIDSRTTYRMTDVVESADSIDFTIVAETGVVEPSEPTDELLGTWVFNEKLDCMAMYYANEVLEGSDYVNYAVGFIYNGANRSYLIVQPSFPPPSLVPGGFGILNAPYADNIWQVGAQKNITITDTSTLTNRDSFTTWLKANATKQ